jgi:hypothetical protein
MGRRVVKQPNGLYAIFSSICDDFVLLDANREEILEELIFRNGADADLKALDRADADQIDHRKNMKSDGLNRWRDALDLIEAVHGKATADERRTVGEAPVEKPVPPPGGNLWGLADIEWVHTERSNKVEPPPMILAESQWLHWKPPVEDGASAWSMMLHFRSHNLVTRKSEAWVCFMVKDAEHYMVADTSFDLYSPRREVVCRATVRDVFSREAKTALDRAVDSATKARAEQLAKP